MNDRSMDGVVDRMKDYGDESEQGTKALRHLGDCRIWTDNSELELVT